MTKVAFLGLGLMGRGMALNVVNAGHDVTVWNRSPEKTQPLVDAGARAAATPAAAVTGAEIIISIVANDEASESVWLDEDGILAGNMAPGAIAVESATLSRDWMIHLSKYCADAGLRFLDCPVTGGPGGAASGQLTLLVGGEHETLADARAILGCYSKKIYHFGGVGAGTSYKLIVNTIGAVQAAAVAEGMAMADAAGLPLDMVAQALGTGSVASRLTAYIAPLMAEDEHENVRFATQWRHKDTRYCRNMADALGCITPVSDAATALFARTVDAGFGALNESAICRLVTCGGSRSK